MARSKQSRATDISQKERQIVYDRDSRCCIICGKRPVEVAHYISRARGGLGIRQNLVCLCIEHHRAYDGVDHDLYKPIIRDYLHGWYMNEWDEDKLVYDKYRWLK